MLQSSMSSALLPTGVAFCALLAFGSTSVQLYGLYHDGSVGAPGQGLYPLRNMPFSHVWEYLDVDVASGLALSPSQVLHAAAVAGVLASAAAVFSLRSVRVSNAAGLLFLLLAALQLELMRHGREFMSFQWDTLLVESCLVAACCVPLIGTASNLDEEYLGGRALMRFTAFKLMLMSGVVKLTAGCAQWSSLSATATHMCTQCLPTPLAHAVHSLTPPLAHNAAVAATLLIEVPAACMLLAPFRLTARVGALLQVALQIGIVATGNYNFFNLLTIVLCSAAWMPLVSLHRRYAVAWVGDVMQAVAIAGASVLSARYMFTLHSPSVESQALNVPWYARLALTTTPAMSPAALTELMQRLLPYIVSYAAVFVVCSALLGWGYSVRNAWRAGLKFSSLLALLQATLAAVCVPLIFASSANHLHTLAQSRGTITYPVPLVAELMATSRFVDAWQVTHGYGLFRHMTGVGPMVKDAYGIRRVTVDRPELDILTRANATSDWTSLPFAYKPGDVSQRPRVCAPAQPRLDWQMWFAALGPASHAPFVFTLMEGVMEGHAPVYTLLDGAMQDREVVNGHEYLRPPLQTRVDKFLYDCAPVSLTLNSTTKAPWMPRRSSKGVQAGTWWHRRYQEAFLPELIRADRRLAAPLDQIGAARVYVRRIMQQQQQRALRHDALSLAPLRAAVVDCVGSVTACTLNALDAVRNAKHDARALKAATAAVLIGVVRVLARDPFQFAAYAYSHTHTHDGAPLVISRIVSRTSRESNASVLYVTPDAAAAIRGDVSEREPLPPLLHASLAGSATYYTPSTMFVIAMAVVHVVWRCGRREPEVGRHDRGSAAGDFGEESWKDLQHPGDE